MNCLNKLLIGIEIGVRKRIKPNRIKTESSVEGIKLSIEKSKSALKRV